ncbi:hypothetical protein [Streptomyces sp. CB00271]|uniref:WXG100-like domain-containing protein n=1 Tax=Streptomyces sp. CB00271 TaxID=2750025 RepID=UPI0037D9B9F6
MPTPEINAMIFALTGEFLTTIDEDLADRSQYNFTGMARKIEQLSALIEKSVHDIAQAMPDELSSSYKQAMGTLVDDQGKNYLLEFTKQLDEIGRGRRKTGMDVMESKWQVIAEIVRLLIEIAIYLALSFFTGGASASQILVAKLRSRFVLLTLFSHLLKRLHLMPALSEALAEAFTTFAVRLAMMNFAPDGRRPDGIDWGDIGKAAAFGAAAGFFTSLFENWAKNIVKSYDTNFLKDGPLFKDKPDPGPDLKLDTPNPKPGPDSPNPKPDPDPDPPTPKPGPDSPTPEPKPEPKPTPEPTPGPRPGPEPTPEPGPNPKPDPEPAPTPGGGPKDRPRPDLNIDPPAFLRDRPFTFRYDPAVWRSNPDLWRNQRLLENNADRPGALAGHYGLKGVLDFAAAGGGESVGEVLIKGAFEGDFSSNWTTFVGAGVSSKVEGGLADIAVNTGNELRTAIENLRNQPPTVSGGPDTDGPARSGGGDGSDRTGGQPRTESSSGGGPTPGGPQPTGSPETTDLDEYTGSPSPRPDQAESPPPHTPQDPPAYVPVDPPSYTPGPNGTETAPGPNGTETAPGPNGTPGPAEVDTDGTTGDAPAFGDSPATRGTPGDAVTGPPTADRTDTDAGTGTGTGPGSRTETPPLTVIVSETPPSLVDGSPEAAALLDGAGADRAVVLGPPTGADATGLPERGAFELTREGPGAPVQVRPLGGPEYVEGPNAPGDTAFPGTNVLLPLADALGVPPVATATPPPPATATPPPASTPPPTSAPPGPRPVTEGGPAGEPGAVEPAPGERMPESPVGAETEQRDIDPSAIKVVSGEQTPVTSGTGPDATTTGPDATTTPPDTAPDTKPLPVTTSTPPAPPATPTTSTDVPAASKPAADARPWTETATDLHLESGRDDGNPTATPAVDPPPPGQITVRPADPAQDQPSQTLRDFLPEDQWWTFYIDPKNHQAALDAFPDDPGSYYDHDRSPGFQQGMVSAYTRFLGDPGTVATPMDSTSYRTMHGLATGHLGRTIGWSGGGATQFPLRGETLADDIFDERIGDQLLVYDTTSRDWSTPLPKPRPVTILTRFLHNNPSLATNYGKNAAPGLVDTLFQQHYARVSEPDADDTVKLASIVRTVRALHVVHPFQDGNLRSNVQILLPKLLLEQGLRPVVPDNMYSLFQGGRSVPQMVEALIRNGALDTVSPRPPQGQTAADVHLESRQGSVIDTVDEPVAPITTSSTDHDASTPPPTPEPSVTTLDNRTVPFSELRRFVPQARFAPQPGVAVQTLTISQSPAEDGTGRSAGREALLGQDSFRGVRTTPAEPPPPGSTEAPPAPRTVFTGPPAALPGSGTERGADYFVGHGTPRTVTLGTDNAAYPTVKVSGVQLGELLKSWAQDGDQDRPLVLFSCETGQQPMVAGLPVAQHVANRTGRPVYAPTTEAGTAKDRDGHVRAVLGEGVDGPGRWRLFTPEPAGADLDGLARDAGLHAGPDPADAFARARTLQQIRTLREALGTDAEQQAGNRELLAALAYVDGLRWHDPGTAARYGDGRMTPELLDRMVTDWHTATNGTNVDPATGPTPEQYRAFLEAAAALRAGATPATTLDTLLPPPPPELPPDTLVSQPDVLGLSYARSAQITWSLSNAPLPLSELGLGPDDTAELARRLHRPEPAAPPAPPVRQDAPGPDGTPAPPRPPAPLPVNSLVVNAYTARHVYGIPEKNFDKFRDVARDRNVVVDVRPTNPSAPDWLDAGAMPKPQDIKAKTVNEVDVHLGAEAGTIGLVGYFQPVLPDQGSVPVEVWDRVVSRFNQRSTEFHELAGKMARYEADGKFTVHEGIVFGFDGEGARRPITGDHDLFDVSSPDGSRISHPAHDALIDEMRAKDMAVVHGAHMFWNPPTAFDKSVFDKIVNSHQGPSGEPLLRFSPNSDHAVLTWTQKLKPGQVDSYTARHVYGIPEKNFDKFRDVARDRNVVVDVRPTNPSAPDWLDAGAMPKPQDIKAKTVNEVDVLLGADAGNVGLVGYFQPVLPDQGSVPVEVWDRVVSRFNQRSTEFHELAGKMARYEADGKFTVHEGIVFGFDDEGGRRPITGDHDLFDVSSPEGVRIPPLDHDALIEEMRAKDMAVVHGAHMFWNPPTAFDKSVFDKIVSSHEGATGEPLLRFSPGNDHAVLVHPEPRPESPPPARPESIAEDVRLSGKDTGTPALADTVRADGQAFRRLPVRADGDCLFRSLLDTARTRPVPPPWAARNVTGLRSLLRDRLTGSELLAPDVEATPDPVLAVVDDLRMTALAGVRNPEARERIGQRWDGIEQAVVTGGDARRWRQILKDSGYSHLADVAPTPADARRLGTDGLILAAAELPALWSSPFADALPLALAHTLDVELRLVRPDGSAPGGTSVTPLNPGGRGGTLHVAYNGTDHFDALVPAASLPAPAPTPPPVPAPAPTPPPVPAAASPDPAGPDVFGEWLRSLGGVTDLDSPAEETPDRGDPVPLETQLERQRPARLLTGEDARPPGPAPRTVTFDDGSRLPAVLISPDADPDDGSTGPGARSAAGTPRTGLLNGPGVLTLRSPEQVAKEVFDQLPKKLRAQFDEAELLRLLKDQPSAFTAPRGARFVGREKSGVGHEMIVEAVPYHRWERFSEVGGATVRLDTMRRGQAGTGGGRSVGVGRRVAAALGMGPPLNWMLKIGVSLGWTRRTDYTQGTQAYHQSEYRAWEGSHLHLDDVHYRVRVERVTEAPTTPAPTPPAPATSGPGTPPAATPRWQRSQVHSAAFAMRDGLTWRLPDDLTVPFKGPKRAPDTLTFPDGAEPRITDTTALHLTDPPEDVALAISGARPGSSAHRTLVSYVRPGRLLGLFGRFAGPVSGPELTRGSGQHPLGHLIVERSVPHRATLVTESVKAEVRDLTQTTYQNQRAHVRDTRLGVQVTAGPNYTLIGPETDVRIQGGPLVRTDLSAGRGHYLGTDAARKVTGRVRNHPMALYRVERTLMVRKAGQPASAAVPVRVVSLDWYSTQDARRLAGWDSRTPGATGPNPDAEPPVPWYLTRQDPVHLGGQVRAEGFVPDQRPPAPAATTTAPAPATTTTAPAPATTTTAPAPATTTTAPAPAATTPASAPVTTTPAPRRPRPPGPPEGLHRHGSGHAAPRVPVALRPAPDAAPPPPGQALVRGRAHADRPAQRAPGARGAEPAEPRAEPRRPDDHRSAGHPHRGRQGPAGPPHAHPARPPQRPAVRDHPQRTLAAQRRHRHRNLRPGAAGVHHPLRRRRTGRFAARPRQGPRHRAAPPGVQRRPGRPSRADAHPRHQEHRRGRPRPADLPERRRSLQLSGRVGRHLRGPPPPARLDPAGLGGAAGRGRLRQQGRGAPAVHPGDRDRRPGRAGRPGRPRLRPPRPRRPSGHRPRAGPRPRAASALRHRCGPTPRRHAAPAPDQHVRPAAREQAAQRPARGPQRRGRRAAPTARPGHRRPRHRHLLAGQRARHPDPHRPAPGHGRPRHRRSTRPVPRPVRLPHHRAHRRGPLLDPLPQGGGPGRARQRTRQERPEAGQPRSHDRQRAPCRRHLGQRLPDHPRTPGRRDAGAAGTRSTGGGGCVLDRPPVRLGQGPQRLPDPHPGPQHHPQLRRADVPGGRRRRRDRGRTGPLDGRDGGGRHPLRGPDQRRRRPDLRPAGARPLPAQGRRRAPAHPRRGDVPPADAGRHRGRARPRRPRHPHTGQPRRRLPAAPLPPPPPLPLPPQRPTRREPGGAAADGAAGEDGRALARPGTGAPAPLTGLPPLPCARADHRRDGPAGPLPHLDEPAPPAGRRQPGAAAAHPDARHHHRGTAAYRLRAGGLPHHRPRRRRRPIPGPRRRRDAQRERTRRGQRGVGRQSGSPGRRGQAAVEQRDRGGRQYGDAQHRHHPGARRDRDHVHPDRHAGGRVREAARSHRHRPCRQPQRDPPGEPAHPGRRRRRRRAHRTGRARTDPCGKRADG